MVISISALKGFLLEEALAKLLENSGYSLITKDVLDNPELYPEFVSQGNGLNIKGRGGTHQADVLGQFPIAVPFNYPIRLFLEAKFRNSRTSIDVVRSGIGILTDLNANYQTIDLSGDELLVQRYNYQYAIFSTSGFSVNAIKLAVAYKITLIDLSGDEYRNLLEGIDLAAHELRELLEHGLYSLSEVRECIRSKLFAVNQEDLIHNNSALENALSPFLPQVINYGDLYLASINSPFSILLKPNFPDDFRNFIKESRKSTFDVYIYWQNQNQNLWSIRLIGGNNQELTFYLPKLLNDFIFNNSNRSDVALNALNAKDQFLGNIIFYMKNEEKFIIFKYERIPSY